MNKILIASTLLFVNAFALAEVDDIVKYYFEDDTWYNRGSQYGKTGKGSNFDLCDSYFNTKQPGDKITAITAYSSNVEYIKGLKIEYLYAPTEEIGKTSGSGKRLTLEGDEFINKYRFYKKNEGSISRIRLWTNTGSELYFGSSNGWDKWQEVTIANRHAVTGLFGTYSTSSGKVWSLGACGARPSKLDFVDLTFDTSQATVKNSDQFFYAEALAKNYTPTTQSASVNVGYWRGESNTDTWSETRGVSATMGVKITQGIKVGEAVQASSSVEWSLSETISFSETVGGSASENTTQRVDYNAAVNVPGYTVYALRVKVNHGEADFPYTATFKNPYDSKTFTFKGILKDSNYSGAELEWLYVGDIVNGNIVIKDEYLDLVDDQYPSTNLSLASTDKADFTVVTSGELGLDEAEPDEELTFSDLNIADDDSRWQPAQQ
ncbi:hypothetical protein CHH28_18195 [Bacterioplanes sanyensis]|uniref:Uncharacterized protein n=1 Tax=Bacterioplanes sanyensis TaxID=1249553 RepID=A0A222FQ05_9GAMM|nr:hypothetical protein [Bacterioplanes sanyensis]ASP40481.1 hypothetical protein CHH28_18195 [Bacterioplanes sanyensis]